jgi:hypothetical protein
VSASKLIAEVAALKDELAKGEDVEDGHCSKEARFDAHSIARIRNAARVASWMQVSRQPFAGRTGAAEILNGSRC